MVETSYDRHQGDPFVTHRYLKGENFAGFPYKVVRLIGEGGMGAVYEVIDESVDLRYVAKDNPATHMTEWVVPAGTRVIRGPVGPLFGQPGGGSQIFIPDPSVLREP